MFRIISILILVLIIFFQINIYTNSEFVKLTFSQIEEFAIKNSLELNSSKVKLRLDTISSYLEYGLQATNPQLSITDESVKNGYTSESEQIVEFSKTFEMPWIYHKRSKGWKYRSRALELSMDKFREEFLGKIKIGYVKLALLKSKVKEYDLVKTILKDMIYRAVRKEKAGFLPAFKLRLIELVVSSMEYRISELDVELDKEETRWKQSLGIAMEKELKLLTSISFKPIQLQSLELYRNFYLLTPGFKEWVIKEKELQEKISMEKFSFFSKIRFSGGYKKISDGFKGFTLGLSFNLPLLNQNKVMQKKQKLEMELHRSQFYWQKMEVYRKINSIHLNIARYKQFLISVKMPPISPSQEIKPIIEAFNEGVVSISDLLSSIQIYLDGLDQYFSILTKYYANIFKLEILTGKKLVVLN